MGFSLLKPKGLGLSQNQKIAAEDFNIFAKLKY
jgi:hypothetical protein